MVLHESTRRNAVRAAFLAFAVAPVCAIVVWCLRANSPTTVRRVAATLSAATRMQPEFSSASFPRPGVVRLDDFALRRGDGAAALVSSPRLELRDHGDWLEVRASELMLASSVVPQLAEWGEREFAALKLQSHNAWQFVAERVRVASDGQTVFEATDVTAAISPYRRNHPMWLEFALADDAQAADASVRVTFAPAGADQPARAEIFTGGAVVPAELAGLLSPELFPQLAGVYFSGGIECTWDERGLRTINGGVGDSGHALRCRFHFPAAPLPGAEGPAVVEFHRLNYDATREQAPLRATGWLAAGAGEVSGAQLVQFVETLGGQWLQTPAATAAGRRVAFSRLDVRFQFDDVGRLHLTGGAAGDSIAMLGAEGDPWFRFPGLPAPASAALAALSSPRSALPPIDSRLQALAKLLDGSGEHRLAAEPNRALRR